MTTRRTFAFVAVVVAGCGGNVVVDSLPSGSGGAGAGGSSMVTSNGGGPASTTVGTTVTTTVTTTASSSAASSSSGVPGCGFPFLMPQCVQCLESSCCTVAEQCSADPACKQCFMQAPNPPPACQMDGLFGGLVSCVAMNGCSAACGVASGGSSSATSSSGTTCQQACALKFPAGEQRFLTDELKECGCAVPPAPCAGACAGTCANPSTFTLGSPCGMCLVAEAAKGTSSACTVKAASADCQADTVCQPYLQCVLPCVLGG